jgi:hypothetical protein
MGDEKASLMAFSFWMIVDDLSERVSSTKMLSLCTLEKILSFPQ